MQIAHAIAGRPLAALLVLAGLTACRPASELPVYLTLPREDATRTVAVHWQSVAGGDRSRVHYDVVPRGGQAAAYARSASGSVRRLPGFERSVHVVELTELAPGTAYWFAVDDGRGEAGSEYSFRTPPAEGRVTFVAGGDMGTGLLPRMISRRAADQSPDFVLIGGDVAYAHGRLDRSERWVRWFEDWMVSMRTPEGHLVPMIVAVGNHELDRERADGSPEQRAPWLTFFFHQDSEGRSFFLRRFGPQLALWVLDSGHLVRHAEQVDWLAESLQRHADARFRFALYHVGLYPAYHRWDEAKARAGRVHWLPLFDAAELTAAFENHDHVHKRTHPLRGGRVVPADAGTLYLGGGSWGKSHLEQPDLERWYLALAVRRRHVWRVQLDGDRVHYAALGAAGQVIDQLVQRIDSQKNAVISGVEALALE